MTAVSFYKGTSHDRIRGYLWLAQTEYGSRGLST
jgi:hypothetical protein